MITRDELPDGSTLYTFSGDGPIRPFAFTGDDPKELIDFTLRHLKEEARRYFDEQFPEEASCE